MNEAMVFTKPRLQYLLFYVTSRCNLRCRHCFYLDELNRHDEMSLEEIGRVAEGLHPLSFVRLTGGDPFLRKDLPEIISLFHTRAGVRRMGIITNGTRPEKTGALVDRIYALTPEVVLDIGVSVDGLEETHDDLRGLMGSFARAKETVKDLGRARERHPNLLTSVVTTVTAKNEPELEALFEELASWGVDRLSVNHVRGKVHDRSLLEVPYSRYAEFARRCEQYHLERMRSIQADLQRAKNRMARRAIAEVVEGRLSSIHCLAGAAIGVLYSDGEVNLCEMLEGALPGAPDTTARLGNVREVNYDFYAIWNSDNTERCRQWIKETNCSCTHECFLTASILFSKRNYPALAKEWLQLAWTGG